MASGRRVAFVPPAGAVQEFKVQTASFDAGDGHTAGAMVNVTLKSGTNALKGQGYYYYRDEKLSATDFFVNKAAARSRRSATTASADRSAVRCGCPVQRPRSHVLLRRDRMAVRRVPRARTADGADRRDAQRRLLGAAGAERHRSTIRRRRGSRTASSCARRSRTTSSRRTASTRSRGRCWATIPAPNQRRRRAGAQQLLLDQPAHRRLLLDLDARRSPAHRQAAADGALRPQRSHARRAATGRARSTASARSATTCSASTTASPTTTSTR